MCGLGEDARGPRRLYEHSSRAITIFTWKSAGSWGWIGRTGTFYSSGLHDFWPLRYWGLPIHTHTSHIHVYSHMHIHTHVNIHTHIHSYMHIHIQIHRPFICTYSYVHMRTYSYVHMHTCIHLHIGTHFCTYTLIHSYTLMPTYLYTFH